MKYLSKMPLEFIAVRLRELKIQHGEHFHLKFLEGFLRVLRWIIEGFLIVRHGSLEMPVLLYKSKVEAIITYFSIHIGMFSTVLA